MHYHLTFLTLRLPGCSLASFPTWEEVRVCDVFDLEETIRSAGLAQTKSRRIKDILDKLHERHGAATLEYMRDMTTEDIKAELRQ